MSGETRLHPTLFQPIRWLTVPALDSVTGGVWKPMAPPPRDSLGRQYDCTSTVSCTLSVKLEGREEDWLILRPASSVSSTRRVACIFTATPNGLIPERLSRVRLQSA